MSSVVRETLVLGRRAISDLHQPLGGWATQTLRDSIRRAVLLAIAIWQLMMLWAVFSSSASGAAAWTLAAAHVVVLALALFARDHRIPGGVVIVSCYALGVWDWGLAGDLNSVLTFAACWLVNLAAVSAAFVVPGRRSIAIVIGALLTVPFILFAVNPHWGWLLPGAIIVTQLAILGATRLGLALLMQFSARADAETSAAEIERERVSVMRTARREVAEDTRTLHDTAINTLGAIANAGAGTADVDSVRERCARDISVLGDLQSAKSGRTSATPSLLSVFSLPGLRVEREGASDQRILEVERALPGDVIDRLVGATREAVQNAVKHAQAQSIAVEIDVLDDHLTIAVKDDGIGFGGSIPEGRGLQTSVVLRAQEAGASASVQSTLGAGTTVVLSVPLTAAIDLDVDRTPVNIEQVAATFSTQAGWLWALGVTAVGVVLETANRAGQFTAAYPMLLLNLVAIGCAWIARRHGQRTYVVCCVVLAVIASAAFVLSAAAVDFGATQVVLWQALAPTAAVVLLIALQPPRWAQGAALGLYAVTVVVLTIVVSQYAPSSGAIIPIAGAVGVGLAATWRVFQSAVRTIGARATRDQEIALQARLDVAASTAADAAHRRWLAAGLHEAVTLLAGVANGTLDPRDAAVRDACALEEVYLRQLTQLNADLVHLGGPIASALNASRIHDVRFTVRTGERDVSDEATAARLSSVLTSTIAGAAPGDDVTMTAFPAAEGLHITFVAPHPHLARAHAHWASSASAASSFDGGAYQQVGTLDLFEIRVPVEATSHGGDT